MTEITIKLSKEQVAEAIDSDKIAEYICDDMFTDNPNAYARQIWETLAKKIKEGFKEAKGQELLKECIEQMLSEQEFITEYGIESLVYSMIKEKVSNKVDAIVTKALNHIGVGDIV